MTPLLPADPRTCRSVRLVLALALLGAGSAASAAPENTAAPTDSDHAVLACSVTKVLQPLLAADHPLGSTHYRAMSRLRESAGGTHLSSINGQWGESFSVSRITGEFTWKFSNRPGLLGTCELEKRAFKF